MVICSPTQRELLEKHGGVMLLDSTFGTNKYGFSLFTLMVMDEHNNGFPGAWIITSDEAQTTIEAGLGHLKAEVPGWSPHTFMTDACDGEQNAIGTVFPAASSSNCTRSLEARTKSCCALSSWTR